MDKAYSTNETCAKFCFSDNLNVRHLLEDLDIDGRAILNLYLRGSMWECGPESCDLGYRAMAGCCEHLLIA
jgi:hypothetical protein